MTISDREFYFLGLVKAEELLDGRYQLVPINTAVLDPEPVTPIKFQSEEKAFNWWIHYCEHNSSLCSAAKKYEREAALHKRTNTR
jgi:hypothetical protein